MSQMGKGKAGDTREGGDRPHTEVELEQMDERIVERIFSKLEARDKARDKATLDSRAGSSTEGESVCRV